MKLVLPLFTVGYAAVAVLCAVVAILLMGFAVLELWAAAGAHKWPQQCLTRRVRLRT